MKLKYLAVLLIAVFISCKNSKDNWIKPPKSFDGFLYNNSFDSVSTALPKSLFKNGIHKTSVCFKRKDSTFLILKNKLSLSSEISILIWIETDFYDSNGTIINLSENKKDFPINSRLSIFMNKNRLGVMHQGIDLRKEEYVNNRDFTKYFMSLEQLKRKKIYFLAYVFLKNRVEIYVDGALYAKFDNVPNLDNVNYVTLGGSWNNKGVNYLFNGCMDDLYIYDKALNEEEIIKLMDYSHIYQYAK